MEGSEVRAPGETPSRPRWFERALPLTGVVAALLVLAAVAVPGFRDQLTLSMTRQPDPYVELSFARSGDTGLKPCARTDGRARVAFSVVSHLADRDAVRYRVVVQPGSGRPRVENGSVDVRPGKARTVVAHLPVDGRYRVAVELPGRDQQLWARCGGRS